MTREELQKAINWFGDGKGCNEATRRLLEAARDYIDHMPQTKMIEVWHVEYVTDLGRVNINVIWGDSDNEGVAKDEAHRLRNLNYKCINVTGPHQHEVPA